MPEPDPVRNGYFLLQVRTDCSGPRPAMSGVFHNHSNGNFGLFLGGKADEEGVIAEPRPINLFPSGFVIVWHSNHLGCSRLAADIGIFSSSGAARPSPFIHDPPEGILQEVDVLLTQG